MNYITVTCPHCDKENVYFDDCIYLDELGYFVLCIEEDCQCSFDVDYERDINEE